MTTPDFPQFHAPAGRIIGRRDGAVLRAQGIRYARAARFRPPVPEPPAPTPIQALAPGPACPQAPDKLLSQALGDFWAGARFDEDCLHLSVTTPADRGADERLPVLVWIHGGSYVTGTGDLPFYDPSRLVTEQRVVVVAVTYRLGLFGFLGSPAGTPPNLGLLDLLEALRWVQQNIGAFGGDAACVTLLGHSSGGDAAAHLLIAEGAAGLFRRVILHSAPLGLATGRAPLTRAMTAAVGSFADAATTAEVLAREPLAWRAARRFGLKAGMPFGTQYGAAPLPPEAEIDAAWRAAAGRVDVLIGTTAEEVRFFAVIDPKFQWLGRVPLLGRSAVRLLVEQVSRRIYGAPADAFARRHAAAGGRAYRFTLTYQAPGSPFGAAHTVDLPFLLGAEATWAAVPLLGQAAWADIDRAGRQIRQLWADFARSGQLPEQADIPGVLALHRVPLRI